MVAIGLIVTAVIAIFVVQFGRDNTNDPLAAANEDIRNSDERITEPASLNPDETATMPVEQAGSAAVATLTNDLASDSHDQPVNPKIADLTTPEGDDAGSTDSWVSTVDPSSNRIDLPIGIHDVTNANSVGLNQARNNFVVTTSTDVRHESGNIHALEILSTPDLQIRDSIRVELSPFYKSTDVSPDGSFVLHPEAEGSGPSRSRFLRIYSLGDGSQRDLPFDNEVLRLRVVNATTALVLTKDHELFLVKLDSGESDLVTTFPHTQSVYFRVTPGAQYALLIEGAVTPLLRVVEINDKSAPTRFTRGIPMSSGFVVHHAEISPNGRYLSLSLLNPAAQQKRLRMVDLETGIAIGEADSSDLPEEQNFFATPVLATDQGWWLFETGVAVSAHTQEVSWRFSDSRPELTSQPQWYTCANNRVLSIHPWAEQNRAWQLVVSQLPQRETP